MEQTARLDPVSSLRAYFARNHILLCNFNAYLPSLNDAGGDWNAIIHLIETREAVYSKVYRKRTAYLSPALYAMLKPYKQRFNKLSEESRRIYGFLSACGPQSTQAIKSALPLSGKNFSAAFDPLLQELLVTAMERDRTMNETWSSFLWGTYEQWEGTLAHPLPNVEAAEANLFALLSHIMPEKELIALMK
ncbi:MAG TPA: hypothetical protein VN366_02490 [Feifaniaceae bacterium]|nr:hypothetical protein [Feifaniaceae bacterium]